MRQTERGAWAGYWADAMNVLGRTRTRKLGLRQAIDAGMVGACILFIATCLGLSTLDEPLHNAITRFSVAIPLLAISFLVSTWGLNGERAQIVVQCVQLSAALVDTVGEALVVIGLVDVLFYYGGFAANAFLGSAILVFPATMLLALLIGIGYVLWLSRKQPQEGQHTGAARPLPSAGTDAEPTH
jgi:hypothetical protein